MKMDEIVQREIYVLVCERDCYNAADPNCQAIVLEQIVDDATLENMKTRQANMNGVLGQTRIAKLVFID